MNASEYISGMLFQNQKKLQNSKVSCDSHASLRVRHRFHLATQAQHFTMILFFVVIHVLRSTKSAEDKSKQHMQQKDYGIGHFCRILKTGMEQTSNDG